MSDSIFSFFFLFCYDDVISNSVRVQINVVPVGNPKIHLFPNLCFCMKLVRIFGGINWCTYNLLLTFVHLIQA